MVTRRDWKTNSLIMKKNPFCLIRNYENVLVFLGFNSATRKSNIDLSMCKVISVVLWSRYFLYLYFFTISGDFSL